MRLWYHLFWFSADLEMTLSQIHSSFFVQCRLDLKRISQVLISELRDWAVLAFSLNCLKRIFPLRMASFHQLLSLINWFSPWNRSCLRAIGQSVVWDHWLCISSTIQYITYVVSILALFCPLMSLQDPYVVMSIVLRDPIFGFDILISKLKIAGLETVCALSALWLINCVLISW